MCVLCFLKKIVGLDLNNQPIINSIKETPVENENKKEPAVAVAAATSNNNNNNIKIMHKKM